MSKLNKSKKTNKVKNTNKIKKENTSPKQEGIFNFDNEIKSENKKVTRTTKKNSSKRIKQEDHFIGTKEVAPINKKKLEKIKKEKLKEKRTKEKEVVKAQKRQDELRKRRIKENKKRQRTEEQIKNIKRIKMIAKVFLLLAVCIGIFIFIILSPIFNTKNININGTNIVSKEQVLSLSQLEKDINLFKLSKKQIEKNIKENPYIKKVEIKRKWPDTINIIVTERLATFMLEYGASYAYIDNQGYILEISANKKEGLAKIAGYITKEDEIIPGNRLKEEDLEKLNTVLKIMATAKNNNIMEMITTINIENDSNYTLYLEKEQKMVYLGDCSNLDTRMLYVRTMIEKEKEHPGEIVVDMDLNEKNPFFREKV